MFDLKGPTLMVVGDGGGVVRGQSDDGHQKFRWDQRVPMLLLGKIFIQVCFQSVSGAENLGENAAKLDTESRRRGY